MPTVIIINPHANAQPERRPANNPQQLDTALSEIGKVARPLMMNSTASTNMTLNDGNLPTAGASKNGPHLYAAGKASTSKLYFMGIFKKKPELEMILKERFFLRNY